SSPAISSRRIRLSSSVPIYLSCATRFSIRSMIFNVVLTPTSDDTRTSSRLSRTSSSTRDFPAMALVSFEKNEVFDFSSPLSSDSLASGVISFFSDENIFLKKFMVLFLAVGDRLSELRDGSIAHNLFCFPPLAISDCGSQTSQIYQIKKPLHGKQLLIL